MNRQLQIKTAEKRHRHADQPHGGHVGKQAEPGVAAAAQDANDINKIKILKRHVQDEYQQAQVYRPGHLGSDPIEPDYMPADAVADAHGRQGRKGRQNKKCVKTQYRLV